MNIINIKNYEIFDLLTNSNSIEDKYFTSKINILKKEIYELCNENDFYGPIADNVVENFNKIEEKTKNVIKRLENISSLSMSFKNNYKNADEKAGK